MPKQIGNLTLYSVDDLHRQLDLSKMTIRSYLREGRIRGRKLGVKWYVTEDALRSYFGESAAGQAGQPQKTSFRYVIQGVNDLVSEQVYCDSVEEAVACIEEQAIISLFQVAVVDRESDEVIELVKARDFLERHQAG